MRKHLILLLIAGIFSFSSCSSDDDANESTDPIIGTWEIVAITTSAIDIEECDETSTITFNEDNTGSATFYFPEECEPETTSGNWANLGVNTYQIEVPVLGRQSGTVEFDGPDKFFFQTNIGIGISFQRQ